ncbi:MAG: serine/threonine-protein kinase, partial [Myxococcota bacterium]
MPLECPARVGKYTLLRHLSAGGMADLYEARLVGIKNFRRSLAVKVIRPPDELNESEKEAFVTMFIDEARVCGQLNHVNICQVYELGKFGGLPYMAMELVEGHSLSQIRRKAESTELPLPLPFVAYVVSQVAQGLDHAHRRRAIDDTPLSIVHRDVSPDNVLVSYEGEVKVIDFGVAHASQRRRQTMQGEGLRGKLPYMAPEQARQEPVDLRADIFGLGAILFELLTGRRLYLSTGIELYASAREAVLPDLDRTLGDTPEELRQIIRRCLAKERDERFSSAADVAKVLEPFIITGRSLFGADETARFVSLVFPEKPNQRRADPAGDAARRDTIRTEVVQTFSEEFHKRQTVEVALPAAEVLRDPKPSRVAPRPRKRRAVLFVAVAVLAVAALMVFWPEFRREDTPATEGFVVFSYDRRAQVRMSINDSPLRAPPMRPVALPFGRHRIRFRLEDGKRVFSARRT